MTPAQRKEARERRLCPHGQPIGAQNGITLEHIASCESEEDEIGLLVFYSACDCCDTLMHHATCVDGYTIMSDGRTPCKPCQAKRAAR